MHRSTWPVLAGLLVGALMLVGCSGTQAQSRQLMVNGHGEIYAVPDLAYVTVGVHTESEDVAQALDKNNAQAQLVVEALKRQGIADKDIRTAQFSVSPVQRSAPDGSPQPTVYVVDDTVEVTVRDVGKLGSILDEVSKAGSNEISGVRFGSSQQAQLLSQARDAAIQDAKTQAAEMAKTSGVQLGTLQSISATGVQPVFLSEIRNVPSAQAATPPIASGQLLITADVTLVYEIR